MKKRKYLFLSYRPSSFSLYLLFIFVSISRHIYPFLQFLCQFYISIYPTTSQPRQPSLCYCVFLLLTSCVQAYCLFITLPTHFLKTYLSGCLSIRLCVSWDSGQ